jgi:hypothetical protein
VSKYWTVNLLTVHQASVATSGRRIIAHYYDWLDSIVGLCLRYLCLRYSTSKSISSNETELTELVKLWKDPESFYSLGTAELRNFQENAMYTEMVATFRQHQHFLRPITYTRHSKRDLWVILHGYAFHLLWLDSTRNASLKAKLTDTFSTSATKKKNMIVLVVESTMIVTSSIYTKIRVLTVVNKQRLYDGRYKQLG